MKPPEEIYPTEEIARAVSGSKRSCAQSHSGPKELPIAATAAILATFSRRYLHKWDSAIEGREGEIAVEWSKRLGGLDPQQIQAGLNAWSEAWPPSSEEFRDACLGKLPGGNEFGMNYVPEYHRQENRITDRSRLLSSDMREKNRARAASHIEKLNQALKGKF